MPETVIIEVLQSDPLIIEIGFQGDPGTDAIFPNGADGQVVGYGPGGALVPINLPAVGGFPAGADGQLVGYGPGGVPAAVDPPAPAVSADAANAIQTRPDGLFAPLNIDLGTFN